jgi:carbon starvation protein
LFGISNQLLATVALCVATTIIVKMGRARYMLVTLAPLAWLVSVTFTASYHKILDPNPRIGFLAHAQQLAEKAAGNPTHTVSQLIFNDRLDASVTGVLVILVALILIESTTLWIKILSGRSEARAKETPFVLSRWVAEEQP